jgi:hypothetical protein
MLELGMHETRILGVDTRKSRHNGNTDTQGEGRPGHRNCYTVVTTGENDVTYWLVGGKRLAELPG